MAVPETELIEIPEIELIQTLTEIKVYRLLEKTYKKAAEILEEANRTLEEAKEV